ncbi:Glycerophosphoryl diester phosphodiesterase family-domain-containing protein [Xylariomycetidae sp. FL2044]|nr:Glycerophosphoryl diester phosphodiesterase family-domain-containing protein [Xylariomycetidae sp. FL2044]
MKFGLDYALYQVPEWHKHYINYNHFKRTWQLRSQDSHLTSEAIYEDLDSDLQALDIFRQRQTEWFYQQERQLRALFDWPEAPSALPSTTNLDWIELIFLRQEYRELRSHAQKLQWFDRVNRDAVDKIFFKVESRITAKADSILYQKVKTRWLSLRTDMEESYHEIARSLRTLEAAIGTRLELLEPDRPSPYLRRLLPVTGNLRVTLDELEKMLDEDDLSSFVKCFRLGDEDLTSVPLASSLRKALYSLLHYSLWTRPSYNFASWLLTKAFPHYKMSIDQDCMNLFIRVHGWETRLGAQEKSSSRNQVRDLPSFFRLILEVPNSEDILVKRDGLGRLPLHYVAQHGQRDLCQFILDKLHDSGNRKLSELHALAFDNNGMTPLHHAVYNNHASIITILFKYLETETRGANHQFHEKTAEVLGDILQLAVLSQLDDVVATILDLEIIPLDAEFWSLPYRNALHAASYFNRHDYVKLLLRNCQKLHSKEDMYTDRSGFVNGNTPLLDAAIRGYPKIVTSLLEAGASPSQTDFLGRTPRQLATFHGHLAIAEALPEDPPTEKATEQGQAPLAKKTVPHCNTQRNNTRPAVSSQTFSSDYAIARESSEDFCYTLEIYAPGSGQDPKRVPLPILGDETADEFIFTIAQNTTARIHFNIIRTETGGNDGGISVGNGTAILESNIHSLGEKRQSLFRETEVPILSRDSADITGTVTFSHVIARPYPHLQVPKASIGVDHHRPVLVGHRARTIFRLARIAFSLADVQVTRDLQPVIYHNLSLNESGTDVPIHDVTFDQFRSAGMNQSPHGNGQSPAHVRRPRANSLDLGPNTREAASNNDRWKHTYHFSEKGFKSNTRGDHIQEPLATLDELLTRVPPHVGFNIELKYPRLHEALNAGVPPTALEINTFVDAVLDRIHHHHRLAGEDEDDERRRGRPIILSSFTPEICMLLRVKQRAYPVLFITNANANANAGRRLPPQSDMNRKAASARAAVGFARAWDLAGIVFSCDALLLCPGLIGVVRGAGLLCGSYGQGNDDPGNVEVQTKAGIDLLFADRVGLVAKTLREIRG